MTDVSTSGRRRTGRAVAIGAVLALALQVAAVVATAPSARPAHAAVLRPTGATTSQLTALRALEANARSILAEVHQLQAEDPRMEKWLDDEIRGLMWLLLVQIINKDASARTADEQQIYSWFQERVRVYNATAASHAKSEFQRWDKERCNYKPPHGMTYSPGSACVPNNLAVLFGSPAAPTLEKFIQWGSAVAALQLAQTPDLGPALEDVEAIIAGVGGAAAIGAATAVSFAALAAVEAAIFPFHAVAGGAAASFGGAVFAGPIVIIVLAIVLITLRAIQIGAELELPQKIDQYVSQISSTAPDLKALLGSKEGALQLEALFIKETLPRSNASITDAQAATDTGDRFVVQPFLAGSPNGSPARGVGVPLRGWGDSEVATYRAQGGWLVETKGGTNRLTQSIRYKDWNGNKRWALLRHDGFVDVPGFDPANASQATLPNCSGSNCQTTNTIRALLSTGQQIELRFDPNDPPAPGIQIVGDGTYTEGESETFFPTSIGTDAKDSEGDAVTFAWSAETRCKFQAGVGTVGCIGPVDQPEFDQAIVTSTARSPSFTFPDDGSYLVKLVMTDAFGVSSTSYREITVGNATPTLNIKSQDFSSSPATITGCIDDPAGHYEAPAVEVDWGDGTEKKKGHPITGDYVNGTFKIVPPSGGGGFASLARIDQGVAISFDPLSGCTGAYSFTLTHDYAGATPPAGGFTVSVAVDDEDGGRVTQQLAGPQPPLRVTIDQATGTPDPTNGDLKYLLTFSDWGTGFSADLDKLILTGPDAFDWRTFSTIDPVPNSDDKQFLVTIPVDQDGTYTLSAPAGFAVSPTAVQSSASTSTDNIIIVDETAPVATVSHIIGHGYRVKFSEPVTGFDASDVEVAGPPGSGPIGLLTIKDGSVYLASVPTPADGNYLLSVTAGAVTDKAGNTNAIGSLQFDIDRTRPGVTINQATAQADPTSGSTVAFDVQFTEAVTGFGAEDVELTGPVGSPIGVSGSDASYTVTVPVTGSGVVTAKVHPDAATDGKNTSDGSSSTDNDITVDQTAPSVQLGPAVDQADPTGNATVRFDVAFSESVTGFVVGDLQLSGTATRGTPTIAGSGQAYRVSVPLTSDGTVTLAIPAGAAVDVVGHPNTASTSPDDTITRARVPIGPTSVTATSGPASKQITLNWNAAQPNGSPITSYIATCKPAAANPGLPTRSATTGPGKRSVVIGALVGGKKYSCTVRAVNANGSGPNVTSTPLVVTAKA
jgi:hypothetical protein